MIETVTLQLPSELVDRARAEGRRTGRAAEEVLAEWLAHNGAPAPATLSDEEVLALCDSQMPEAEHQQLSELLGRQREQLLGPEERARLVRLLDVYKRGLLRKAEALRVAVARGLRPPLGDQFS